LNEYRSIENPKSQIENPHMSYSDLLESAVVAARQAGDLITGAIGSDLGIQYKNEGKNNLVTLMDTASEEAIRKVLSERHPEVLFLAEESGGNEDLEPLTWVVDPIDGTVNYAHGIPLYCISIAAVQNNEPVVGVIYNPNTNELFTASKGEGAHLNGVPLKVSANDELERAILVTGFPYNVEENPFGCLDSFVELVRMGIPVRRLGSAALDLAYVAAGRFDAFWEVALHPWDVAAGIILVTEAGGVVGTYAPEGMHGALVTDRILASNGRIHEELRSVLLRVTPGIET
jgi:myo-inositol-1(or 4)-monophosphatase